MLSVGSQSCPLVKVTIFVAMIEVRNAEYWIRLNFQDADAEICLWDSQEHL